MEGFKGSDKKGPDKNKKKVAPLTAAALTLIKLLSGTPAASEAGWKTQVIPAKTAPQLKSLPKEVKPPKKWERFAPAADSQFKIDMTRSFRVTGEGLADAIAGLEERLAPGGLYMKALESETLTKEYFARIVNELSRFSGLLSQVEAGIIPSHPELKKYLFETTPPGLVSLKIPVRRTDGRVTYLQCGGERVVHKGKVALITNTHCIRGKGYVAVDIAEWFPHPGNVDLAMKMLEPETMKPAILLDTSTADYRGGRVGKVDAFNKFGTQTKYNTFVIPMTQPVLRILAETMRVTKHEETQFMQGNWFVSLPDEVMPTMIGDMRGGINAQGQSGTSLFVSTPKGLILDGPLFAGRQRAAECVENATGLCTSIMLSASRGGVIELFEEYKKEMGGYVPSRKRDPLAVVTKVFDRLPDGGIDTAREQTD